MVTKQLYAIFMSILILILPIVSATSIYEIRSYGLDGTNGYRRASDDKTIIEATVGVDNDDLMAPEQVKVGDVDFQSCDDLGSNRFKCIYEDADTGMYEAKSYPFTVSLFDDNGMQVGTKTGSITYDNEAPKVIDVEVKQVGNEVKATYKLKDTACADDSCKGKCSGFSKLEIIGQKAVVLNSSRCEYTGTETIEVGSGTHTLTMNVYDGAGNIDTYVSEPFAVDKTTPKIETDKVQFYKDGKEVKFIGKNGLSGVEVVVYIEEENLDAVIGDLSSLNKITHYKLRYVDMKAQCSDVGGAYLCKWGNIVLQPEGQSGVIEIAIKDTAGNEVLGSLPFQLSTDDSSPKVTAIESNCNGQACFLRAVNNTLKVKISESGSGFNRVFRLNGQKHNFVALNLGQLASRYGIQWADECRQESGSWVCYWYNVEVTKTYGSNVKVFVADGSQDDASNIVEGLTEASFIIDTKAPEMTEIAIGSGSNWKTALQGEGLNVKLTLKEDSPMRAIGYFGSILNDGKDYPVSCAAKENSTYVCEWNKISVVALGPLKDAEYKIKVIDLGGNEAVISGKVDVLEAEGLPKNYWWIDGDARPRPAAISKDTLFREQKVYFTLPLLSAVTNIKVIDASLSKCTNNVGLKIDPKVQVMPNGAVYASAKASGTDVSLGAFQADCVIKITSVVDRTRVSQPQELNVKLSVPIVSASLGSIEERVADKINSAKDDIKTMGGPFRFLEKIYDLLDKICQIKDMMQRVTQVFNIFTKGLGKYIELPPAQPGKRAVQGVGRTLNSGVIDLQKQMGRLCNLLSCTGGPLSNVWNKGYDNMVSKGTSINLGGAKIEMEMWPKDTKESLVLSIIKGCIPGIIYNLKKMKQIQCMYLDCLMNQVPQGTPVAYCEEMKGYQECRFVYGQMFELIPYGHALKQLGTFLQNALHDPLSLIFTAGTMICKKSPENVAKGTEFRAVPDGMCKYLVMSKVGAEIMKDMEAVKQSKNLLSEFDKSGDVCKKVGM